MHPTTSLQLIDCQEQLPSLIAPVERCLLPLAQSQSKRGPGKPVTIQWPHLWLGLLLSVLLGMKNYQQWWRRMCSQPIGPFAPLAVTDDALIKRLKQAGIDPLLALLQSISQQLACQLEGLLAPCPLAPFASRIVAIDETTWDAVQRHLKPLRELSAGDVRLLAGKLAGRFNIRTQQWELVQWRSHVLANCKVEVLSLLEGLPALSLILFDLGYFSFPWLDYLTQMQYWFVCRLREKVSYRLVHTYYRHEGILDALIWVGAYRSQRSGQLLRLVRFHDGTALRSYLTNVLDPTQLTMPQVAQLYARRWDIELAFLTLKQHLGLHHWWSSQAVLLQQQCLLVLIVAQLLQALRLQIAVEAGVDPFEVSLPLLIEYVPYFITSRQSPLRWILTYGKQLGFLRPSSRYIPTAPEIARSALTFPAQPIQLSRPARYMEYVPLERCPDGGSAKVSKTASAKKRAAAKQASHPSLPVDS
ncbi:MAG TPA: IS4 family transposase [Ktedonobacteraceae bacterium]|nr:IS4 family transposase [Ktedonobacteraceae bacterium]